MSGPLKGRFQSSERQNSLQANDIVCIGVEFTRLCCSTRMSVYFLIQREILCNLKFSVQPLRFVRFSGVFYTNLSSLHAIACRNEDAISRGSDVVGACTLFFAATFQ